MPTVQNLVKEVSKLKTKEVPGAVQKFAAQHWTPAQLQGRFMNWLQNYKVKVSAGWCEGGLPPPAGPAKGLFRRPALAGLYECNPCPHWFRKQQPMVRKEVGCTGGAPSTVRWPPCLHLGCALF